MRLMEFLTADEQAYLKQLMFDASLLALHTYQQQQAQRQHHQRWASKPIATLKHQAGKKARSLARKAKHPPRAPAPRPLPKPKPLPLQQTQAQIGTNQPSKKQTPLPHTVNKAPAPATQPAPQNPKLPATMQAVPNTQYNPLQPDKPKPIQPND